jgi:hypothetical protein
MGADVMEAVSGLDAIVFPNDDFIFCTPFNNVNTGNTSFFHLMQLISHAALLLQYLRSFACSCFSYFSLNLPISRCGQNVNFS